MTPRAWPRRVARDAIAGAWCRRALRALASRRRRADAELAVRAPAAAAGGARRQVPAVRDSQTLPNGLQVVAVLHHEQPVVSMRMLVRAGSALDPKGKLGVAHADGVAARSGHDDEVAPSRLNDAIDFIGGDDGRRRGHRSHASSTWS